MKYNASMLATAKRLPPWVLNGVSGLGRSEEVKARLRSAELVTVCEEARCPNIGECFSRHTATFMILGDTCTRRCGFCSVKTGRPARVDSGEAGRVAVAAADMGLAYVVITMVARDDLRDHGAQQLVRTIEALHGLGGPDDEGLRSGTARTLWRSRRRLARSSEAVRVEAIGGGGESGERRVQVEVLVSDLGGRAELIAQVLEAGPEVFGHNLETVRRLTPAVRGRATYERSLSVLAAASLQVRDARRDALRNAALHSAEDTAARLEKKMAAHSAEDTAARLEKKTAAHYAEDTAAHAEKKMPGRAMESIVVTTADSAAQNATNAAGCRPPAGTAIKSGLMAGLGESRKELSEAMRDIRAAGCDLLTVGQYLRPTRNHLPVERYLEPVEFEEIAVEARELGFREIAAGPLVRSSYRADSLYRRSREQV